MPFRRVCIPSTPVSSPSHTIKGSQRWKDLVGYLGHWLLNWQIVTWEALKKTHTLPGPEPRRSGSVGLGLVCAGS